MCLASLAPKNLIRSQVDVVREAHVGGYERPGSCGEAVGTCVEFKGIRRSANMNQDSRVEGGCCRSEEDMREASVSDLEDREAQS